MNIKNIVMKDRHLSFSEYRSSIEKCIVDADDIEKRRNSYCMGDRKFSSAVSLNVKMEKYRNLLEKEYQLRYKLERARSDLEISKSQCVHCCAMRETQPMSSTPHRQHINYGKEIAENRRDIYRRNHKSRPLSADNIHIPMSAMLRKEEARQKAERRRASIQSLEDDFLKYKTVLSKTRAFSMDESKETSLESVTEEKHTSKEVEVIHEHSKCKIRPASSYL